MGHMQTQLRKRQIWLGSLVGAVLLLGACGGSDPEPRTFGADQDQCTSNGKVETLTLQVTGAKAAYKRGGTINVFAQVEREDSQAVTDLKANLHPGGVDGAEVTLALASKGGDLVGYGTTGDSGVANIKIRVPRATKPGIYNATGFATKKVADGPCHLEVSEVGNFKQAKYTRIK